MKIRAKIDLQTSKLNLAKVEKTQNKKTEFFIKKQIKQGKT
jgi:hypothetical protein